MNQAGGTKCLKALIWLGYHRTVAANGKSPINNGLECAPVLIRKINGYVPLTIRR